MTTILQGDPGSPTPPLASLTPDQCRNVAYEIAYSQQDPLPPIPPVIPFTDPDPLGDMYTNPPNPGNSITGSSPNSYEQNRQQLESALTSYYATRNATALQLTNYVAAVVASAACEALSLVAPEAILQFPANPAQANSSEASVVLTGISSTTPPGGFGVPAGYFYALTAHMPAKMPASQRFQQVVGDSLTRVLPQLTDAVNASIISDTEPFITPAVPPSAINPAQAARRLGALNVPMASVAAPYAFTAVQPIVSDWLTYPPFSPPVAPVLKWQDYQPGYDDSDFWPKEASAQPLPFLELVLAALTQGYIDPDDGIALAVKIKKDLLVSTGPGTPPPKHLASVADLEQASTLDWQTFFTSSPAWPNSHILPPFAGLGSPTRRIAAFISYVQNFFAVLAPTPPTTYSAGAPDAVPTLAMPSTDWLQACLGFYQSTPFTFGSGFNLTQLQAAAAKVFTDDPEAQAWLVQALLAIDALYALVNVITFPASVTDPAKLRFSIVEALYARGFTSAADVTNLSFDSFQQALTGTVAYDYASQLHAPTPPGTSGPGPLVPVNPDGSLTNCIPPPCLSPLGPNAYLKQLLDLSRSSSCEHPCAVATDQTTLEHAIDSRRGVLGSLLASCANLETPIPMVDMVNECLENLAANVVPNSPTPIGGVIYNTNVVAVAGHTLCVEDDCERKDEECHEPGKLFCALPEHSSPATPVDQPGGYDKLRVDFSTPCLPYSQPLDISRSYQRFLCACRFDTMRSFRRSIREFVLAPDTPPAGFEAHLWRYPVRLELAVEYLCMTPEEFGVLFDNPDSFKPWTLYGFPSPLVGRQQWTTILSQLPEFLSRTGLSYCEFLDLQKSAFVAFRNAGREDGAFPECEPCYLDKINIDFGSRDNIGTVLGQLGIFIRLWRILKRECCCHDHGLSFTELADIVTVFKPITGGFNADFIRQLAALAMLRDHFRLTLVDKDDRQSGKTGADRTHLLALWVGPGAAKWRWAVDQLLRHVQHHAREHHKGRDREPDFIKILADNLDRLSQLAGFDPAVPANTWHARPTFTLRFGEILSKIYESEFSAGEIVFLFTVDAHLDGDDPFPLEEGNEAIDLPLDLPDDRQKHSLWALRRKLLEVHVDEEGVRHWTWTRIEASLRHEFGYVTPKPGPDPLLSLGKHFFPHILESHGIAVAPQDRRYYHATPVKTSAAIWNVPADGPFVADPISGTDTCTLSTRVPLEDEDVVEKLSRLQQLSPEEQAAVQDLYFQPRTNLAPFAFLFPDFITADWHLIQQRDHHKRWEYFQRHFALTHARCRVIAEHLAHHAAECAGRERDEDWDRAAWLVLRVLFADENQAKAPGWEDPSGKPPEVIWGPLPNGGAFAALLGLTGTGLLGEFSVGNNELVYREVRGPMDAFSHVRNRANCPLPTIVPAIDLKLPSGQQQFVALHNGLATRDSDGDFLGGAQGFTVRWSGAFLVGEEGRYEFGPGLRRPKGSRPISKPPSIASGESR